MKRGPELSPGDRGEIIGMHKGGLSRAEIVRISGFSKAAVRSTLDQAASRAVDCESLPRSGRPEKFTTREKRIMIRSLRNDPTLTYPARVKETGLDMGRTTIRKLAKEEGIVLTPKRKKKANDKDKSKGKDTKTPSRQSTGEVDTDIEGDTIVVDEEIDTVDLTQERTAADVVIDVAQDTDADISQVTVVDEDSMDTTEDSIELEPVEVCEATPELTKPAKKKKLAKRPQHTGWEYIMSVTPKKKPAPKREPSTGNRRNRWEWVRIR